ncbi:unnamed protein product [Lactuca virosa]|uniref:Disease resistance N-terminal domain-containing protein n=1 Tax=Lactuca virosa TaxID=75947 RepID=A0AAU9NBW1_9ASTR|nr:unnamed protein product [Lactuca virosa]
MEWLKQLKDVVGEADDVMDEVHYEMLRREVKNRDQPGPVVPYRPYPETVPNLDEFKMLGGRMKKSASYTY